MWPKKMSTDVWQKQACAKNDPVCCLRVTFWVTLGNILDMVVVARAVIEYKWLPYLT